MSMNALQLPQLKTPSLLFIDEGGRVHSEGVNVVSFVAQTMEVSHAA